MSNTTDVLIVGGGIMGLTSAWRLAQAGVKITLFESRTCGSGASSAALGALWPASALVNAPLQNLHRKSLWEFEAFARELTDFTGKPVPFMRRGRVELLHSEKAKAHALQEAAAACADWPQLSPGPAMEVLSAEELRRQYPEINSLPFGGQVCHRSAQVGVDGLLAALIEACRKAGVVLKENCAVQQLQGDGESITGVMAGGEVYAAGAVLVAAGVHSNHLGFELRQRAPIQPVKGQAMLLKTAEPVINKIVKNGLIFLVPWPDGRVLVGSTTEPDAGFDSSNTVEGVSFLLNGAVQTCPAMASARLERTWAGLRPTGPNKKPVLGPMPNNCGLYVAGGHFKVGIGMAPITGKLIAQMVTTGQVPGEAMPFVPSAAEAALLA